MCKTIQLSLLTILLGLAGLATASTLSISGGGGIWQTTPSGNIKKTTDTTPPVDVEQDLFWTKEDQTYFFITLEHPIPILPNARLSQINLSQSGTGQANFVYDGIPFNGTITNNADLTQTDLLLYYEVLDDFLMMNLDLGLDIKNLDVKYNISDVNNPAISTSDSYSTTVPLLYGMFGVTPIDPLYIGAELYYVTYNGSTITDVLAKISYTFSFHVGIEAGYRAQTIDIDDISNTTGKFDFKGPFAGVYLKF